MERYVCTICGYVYDEAKGAPDAGVPAGTRWAAIAQGWTCPLCGAAKAEFRTEGAPERPAAASGGTAAQSTLKALPAIEMSAVCTNLARGCEKQYLPKEAGWYRELAAYFKRVAGTEPDADYALLLALAQAELDGGIAEAMGAAKAESDRGAQRALVWDEKVTRIHKSLLARYLRDGEAMLEGVNAYVCSACGFIYLGAEPPALCPVCKVPAFKFERVEGRAMA